MRVRSGATRSITSCSTASLAVMETLRRTASSAQRALRPRSSAMARARAAASFTTFASMTSSVSPPPPMPTGCAAPMFVPGAMAATFAARVMNMPADAARAPDGVT